MKLDIFASANRFGHRPGVGDETAYIRQPAPAIGAYTTHEGPSGSVYEYIHCLVVCLFSGPLVS